MLGQVEQWLRQQWPAAGLGPLPPGALRYLLRPGPGVDGTLTCLCWLPGVPRPRLVLKLARTPCANGRVAAEYGALQALQSYLVTGPERAPRPLACAELDGLRVLAETVVPGGPLHAYLAEHPAALVATLQRLAPVGAWFTALHGRSARPATLDDLRAHFLGPLATAGQDLEGTAGERRALAVLHARTVALAGTAPLPLVFNHNDAGPPNILVDVRGGFSGVIDWESGAPGPPATDLLYLLARVAEHSGADGFRAVFYGDGPVAALVRDWLRAYCRSLGVATPWLPVLLATGWIMHARNERRQQITRRATRGAADRRPFRGQLRYFLEHLDACLVSRLGEGRP